MDSLTRVMTLLKEIIKEKKWGAITISFKEGELKTITTEYTTKL